MNPFIDRGYDSVNTMDYCLLFEDLLRVKQLCQVSRVQ